MFLDHVEPAVAEHVGMDIDGGHGGEAPTWGSNEQVQMKIGCLETIVRAMWAQWIALRH